MSVKPAGSKMSHGDAKLAESIRALAALRGWTIVEAPAREGRAARARVHLGEGADTALLYTWEQSVCAERAAWAHRPEHAGVLFAVPQLLDAGERWCLVAQVAGIPLSSYLEDKGVSSVGELDGERARMIVREAGKLARKLHEIEILPEFGEAVERDGDSSEGYVGRWKTFNGFVAHRLEHFADQIRHSEYAEDMRSRLLASIGDLRTELAAFHPRHPPSLNHGSLGLNHLWVDEAGRSVTGLTGFGHARFLPPEADLARLLWLDGLTGDEQLVRAFYAGYGAARTMDLQRRERFYRRMAALEALVDAPRRHDLSDAQLVELTSP